MALYTYRDRLSAIGAPQAQLTRAEQKTPSFGVANHDRSTMDRCDAADITTHLTFPDERILG